MRVIVFTITTTKSIRKRLYSSLSWILAFSFYYYRLMVISVNVTPMYNVIKQDMICCMVTAWLKCKSSNSLNSSYEASKEEGWCHNSYFHLLYTVYAKLGNTIILPGPLKLMKYFIFNSLPFIQPCISVILVSSI